MGIIKKVRGKTPVFGQNTYISENAVITGDVVCGDDCTFWFGSVTRGDVNYIKMGNKVNVQDGAVIHGTFEKAATNIGNNVSIGHRAMVHGCTLEDNVLVGMGAIVMDGAVVKSNSIIAAGAVVLEKTIVEPNSIYAGVPAKKVKEIDPEQSKGIIQRIAQSYVKYASWYQEEE